jgi:hypothetical protein
MFVPNDDEVAEALRIARYLIDNGVPVFAADIKGDLSGIASAGTPSDAISCTSGSGGGGTGIGFAWSTL